MRALSSLLAATALFLSTPSTGAAGAPVVNAVLFYSPTCPHCHKVINEDLPPLRRKYGEQLVIIGVDVTTPAGQELYQAMVAYFALPESRLGVPALVVGADVMVGSDEIPSRFPGAIERGLAAGGIDWPPVPEIRRVLAAEGILAPRPAPEPTEAPAPTPTEAPSPTPTEAPSATPKDSAAAERAEGDTLTPRAETPATLQVAPAQRNATPSASAPAPAVGTFLSADSALALERPGAGALFLRDPMGNGVALVVLVGLLIALAWSVATMLRPGARVPDFPSWLFPVLGVIGAGAAAYLSFVEVTGASAVCGPVGDCNAVQQSDWARLFGVLPVGVLGLAGYAALLLAWGAATWGAQAARARAWTAAWALALVGTAFSAWLTFLEPFVIGATCAWCVTSALAMGLMLVGATARAAAPARS